MALIIDTLRFVLFLFSILLIARIVFNLVMSFSRDWRPRGVTLIMTEVVFTVTDPPIKAVRRFVPPVTLGTVRFDLAFLIVFFAVTILSQWLAAVAYSL